MGKFTAYFASGELLNLSKMPGLITTFMIESDDYSGVPRKGEKMSTKAYSIKSGYNLFYNYADDFFKFGEIFYYKNFLGEGHEYIKFEFEVQEVEYTEYGTKLIIDLTDEMKEKIDFKEARFQFLEKYKDFVEFREKKQEEEKVAREKRRRFWNTVSFGLLCREEETTA
jgi:hypothetical protein